MFALANALAGSVDTRSEPLAALEASWREFSKSGPDRDDATALLVIDSSPHPEPSMECEVSPGTIPELRAFCKEWAEYSGLEEPDSYNAILGCDEIFTNIYRHAYNGHPGRVRCEATIDLISITFLIEHWGIGLTSEAGHHAVPDESRIGGYGLPFVRRVFDRVEFVTRPEHSTVLLSKRFAGCL